MKSLPSITRAGAMAILALAVSSLNIVAANTTVGMANFSFSPSSVTINTGDSVTWMNNGGTHTSTSTSVPSLWDSGTTTSGVTFAHTFSSTGTFPYHCNFHFNFGMTGSVTVNGASAPPTVAITSPANGSVFASPASFQIQASASGGSGSITNVAFFDGTNLLGAVSHSPFTFNVVGRTNGVLALTATATDSAGQTATSSPITVTVTTIKLLSVSVSTGGELQFTVEGNVTGKTNLTQASEDFTNWVTLSTNTTSGFTVSDPLATNFAHRFYRAMELP